MEANPKLKDELVRDLHIHHSLLASRLIKHHWKGEEVEILLRKKLFILK